MTSPTPFLEGGGGAQTIVFLHGIGSDGTSFHHQMQAFSGYRTIAWHMPGYADSEMAQTVPTFADLSARLGALIAKIGGPVHLVGHSIGGMVALEHALRGPNDVKSLAMVAATSRFGGRDDTFKEQFLAARLGPLDRGQTMGEMAAGAVPQLVGPETPTSEIKRIEAAMAAVPVATWKAILRCLVTFDRAADLDQLRCPTLVVAGGIDTNSPARSLQKMAQHIPGAQFIELERTGHFPHQERPAEFNLGLSQFLQNVTHT